ncbi:MAG: diguanylate cyclase [Anaerotignum sp.]|nr:diguanylate cyclase [Anaerotignum sp.]
MVDMLYLQVNVVGMMILSVILINQQSIDDGTGRQKAFIYLVYSVFSILILDSVMWLIDGEQLPYLKEINWVITSICYFFNCFIGFVWFIYVSLLFYDKRIKNPKFWKVICIPAVLNNVLIYLNFKNNIYFSISDMNIYMRGPLFFVSTLIVLPYLIIPFYYCVRIYRTTEDILEKQDSAIIMKIYVLPVIGIVVQNLFYGVSLVWISAVLSLLFIFINFQNKRITTDPLTQLNNRYQFDICLQNIKRGMAKEEMHAIIFIDIDKFKNINDENGHVFGDKVLISVATILRRACDKEDAVIGRYGGDEFYVFCKSAERDEIINRIHQYVEEYNRSDRARIRLSLSIGWSDFRADESGGLETTLERADRAMYKNKVK